MKTLDEVLKRLEEAGLRLLVIQGTGPSLLGRDWLAKLKLDWHRLNRLTSSKDYQLQSVLDQHKAVFKEELGLIKHKAKIHVDSTATPRFCKARTVPYALRSKVEQELDRLEKQGIIEKIEFTEWAAPIVPVVKQDGSVRICGDYKVTVNTAAKVDAYPLPRIEDLFASLNGGTAFTKLDLARTLGNVLDWSTCFASVSNQPLPVS